MTLGELIEFLKKFDPSIQAEMGLQRPHSYRGAYEELAFEPKVNTTIGEMLRCAESAVDRTYTGYKLGEYTMHLETPVHLAVPGDTGAALNKNRLMAMINNPDIARDRAIQRGGSVTLDLTPLSSSELDRLAQLEKVIKRGLAEFLQVSLALAEIKRDELWRASHPSFADYCQETWGKGRAQAYALASAGEVLVNLSQLSPGVPLPSTGRQTRPLQQLPPEQQVEAWQAAIELSPTPTENSVAKVVRALKTETPAIEVGQEMTVRSGEFAGQEIKVAKVSGVIIEGETPAGPIVLLKTELIEPETPQSRQAKTGNRGVGEVIESLETKLSIESARAELLEELLNKCLVFLPDNLRSEVLQVL